MNLTLSTKVGMPLVSTDPSPQQKIQYRTVARVLKGHYKETDTQTLEYETPFQLLLAAILLVQSDESLVNRVTRQLFGRYPDAKAISAADNRTIGELIRPIKFARRKVKHVVLAAEMFIREYNNKMPRDLISLTKFPGVSRRSAYLILNELYDEVAGITVDARVWRVSERLGLAKGHSAESIENQLVETIPHEEWQTLPVLFTQLADEYCLARRPNCLRCPLLDMCKSAERPL